MKKSLYAALLSAIICPGSGQIWLGKKWLGWGFISVSVLCLMVLMDHIISRAQVIAEQILAGNIGNDLSSIYAEVSKVALDTQSADLSGITWLFIANWALSVATAFWLGTKQDRQLANKKAD